jgi:hypothetical protein
VPRLWTHRTRPQVAWKTRTERGFPTPPTPPYSSWQKKKKKIKDKNDLTSTVQIYAVSGERRHTCRADVIACCGLGGGSDKASFR